MFLLLHKKQPQEASPPFNGKGNQTILGIPYPTGEFPANLRKQERRKELFLAGVFFRWKVQTGSRPGVLDEKVAPICSSVWMELNMGGLFYLFFFFLFKKK